MSSPPQPTLQTLPLPSITPPRSIYLVSNLLSPEECSKIIASYINLVPSNVTPTTIRDREVFSNPELATLLWSRISPFFQNEKVVDEDGENWSVSGLNETFRLCRYTTGMSVHEDREKKGEGMADSTRR
jgi:hypothetical protein